MFLYIFLSPFFLFCKWWHKKTQYTNWNYQWRHSVDTVTILELYPLSFLGHCHLFSRGSTGCLRYPASQAACRVGHRGHAACRRGIISGVDWATRCVTDNIYTFLYQHTVYCSTTFCCLTDFSPVNRLKLFAAAAVEVSRFKTKFEYHL